MRQAITRKKILITAEVETPLAAPRCSLYVLKRYKLKFLGIYKRKHIDSHRNPLEGFYQTKIKVGSMCMNESLEEIQYLLWR